jgi:hypothetical protein
MEQEVASKYADSGAASDWRERVTKYEDDHSGSGGGNYEQRTGI